MRRPRMTTRRWMIVVGLVAAVLGVFRLFERSYTYAYWAGRHAEAERFCRQGINVYEAGQLSRHPYTVQRIERYRRLIPFHAAMRRKYESAMHRPWLAVEPDPPEPQ